MQKEETQMVNWALTFLLAGLLSAMVAFSGISLVAANVGKALFEVFMMAFLYSLIANVVRRA